MSIHKIKKIVLDGGHYLYLPQSALSCTVSVVYSFLNRTVFFHYLTIITSHKGVFTMHNYQTNLSAHTSNVSLSAAPKARSLSIFRTSFYTPAIMALSSGL